MANENFFRSVNCLNLISGSPFAALASEAFFVSRTSNKTLGDNNGKEILIYREKSLILQTFYRMDLISACFESSKPISKLLTNLRRTKSDRINFQIEIPREL